MNRTINTRNYNVNKRLVNTKPREILFCKFLTTITDKLVGLFLAARSQVRYISIITFGFWQKLSLLKVPQICDWF